MSLLRTAARASVATRVVGNVQRRQNQRWAAQDAMAAQAPAPPAPPAPAAPAAPLDALPWPAAPAPATPAPDMQQVIEQLRQLGELRGAGVLTEAEFELQKARILG